MEDRKRMYEIIEKIYNDCQASTERGVDFVEFAIGKVEDHTNFSTFEHGHVRGALNANITVLMRSVNSSSFRTTFINYLSTCLKFYRGEETEQ